MKIGIIGTGMVGKTPATRFAENGHQVLVANSRGPGSVADNLSSVEAPLTPASMPDALACKVIFLAVP